MTHGLRAVQLEEQIEAAIIPLRETLLELEAGLKAVKRLRESHYYMTEIAAARATLLKIAREAETTPCVS
jgi:hypothetical protein